ncbi:MAG TPA: FAD-dependent oxidoreductase [Vitreimonas sp.]|uniref:FAD-dependent oxidoreductase n=1 Tax=Vitreimonas sp. TaxID=3069702 RepID=UPI002D5EBA84|nr:FAD-dependent oxidoreductase [Vitreimonas sp.]HYD86725.1 FAD-dependent oxidoreductase [Vitreimonas sp.]
MGAQQQAGGPDFALGVALAELPEGTTLAGRVGDEPVLMSRRGGQFYALSGACTHYGAPLGEGLVAGDHVRCPWHHACFDLRTGEAIAAPAFQQLARWRVDIEGERAFVRERLPRAPAPAPAMPSKSRHPDRILILGGGAAGFAAADMLRRSGFSGALTMLSADASPPCDRPNLSKDYLAGTAPEDWIPLKDDAYYQDRAIDLRLETEVETIDLGARHVATRAGETFPFDALLLATGASPIRLPSPGFDLPNVHVLRSVADARAIIARAQQSRSAAIVGAGFIGLEVAASLRARGLDVHVIAPDHVPLQRVLGPEIGRFVQSLHESQGVRFHLGRTADSFDGRTLGLSDGGAVDADLIVVGIGVAPNVQLAAAAGLSVNNGVLVDGFLRTSAPGVFAAGDIARYRDPRLDEHIRIEHWVAAERQGQTAALNMLGADAVFADTPFFWSKHYEHSLHYVGQASSWDHVAIEGSIGAADFTARFLRNNRLLAAVSLGRPRETLALHEQMNTEAATAF